MSKDVFDLAVGDGNVMHARLKVERRLRLAGRAVRLLEMQIVDLQGGEKEASATQRTEGTRWKSRAPQRQRKWRERLVERERRQRDERAR